MANGSRTRLAPDERRAQLIELGVDLLSRNRLEQVPIDQIAEAAGISRGLLFHYFPSKRDFYLSVVEKAAEQLLRRTAPDPSLPLLEQLRSGVDTFVAYVTDNRDTYMSLVRGAAGCDADLQAIFDRTRTAFCERVLSRLGVETPVRPTVWAAVRGWVAYADELIVDWLSRPEPDMTREELVDLLEHSLVALVQVGATRP